jgi:hypothetical protein
VYTNYGAASARRERRGLRMEDEPSRKRLLDVKRGRRRIGLLVPPRSAIPVGRVIINEGNMFRTSTVPLNRGGKGRGGEG